MIPKKIHYCWFGGKAKPQSVLDCIASWKRVCPDYDIVEWNESNFDIHINPYCEQAYSLEKWAFVSDVVRVYALSVHGGIYMDTDVEAVRSFDDLLHHSAFFGFEGTEWVATSTMGAEAGNPIVVESMERYAVRQFLKEDNTMDLETNVRSLTALLVSDYGVILNGQEQDYVSFHIFPTDYFTPYDYISGRMRQTSNTHTIHWFGQSWIDIKSWRLRLAQFFHRIMGMKMK